MGKRLYKLGLVALLGMLTSCHNYEKEHRIHKVHQAPEHEQYLKSSVSGSVGSPVGEKQGYTFTMQKRPLKSSGGENRAQQRLMEKRYKNMLENQKRHEELQRKLKGTNVKEHLSSSSTYNNSVDKRIGEIEEKRKRNYSKVLENKKKIEEMEGRLKDIKHNSGDINVNSNQADKRIDEIAERNKKNYLEMLEYQKNRDLKRKQLEADEQALERGKKVLMEEADKAFKENRRGLVKMWNEYKQLFQSGKYEEVINQSKNIEKELVLRAVSKNIDKIRRCDLQRMYMVSSSYYALGRYGPAYATATAGIVLRDKHNELMPEQAIYCPRLDGIAALAAVKFAGKRSAMKFLKDAEKKYETQPKYKAHIHMYKAKLQDNKKEMLSEYQTAVDLSRKAYGDEAVKQRKLYQQAMKILNKY